MNWVITNCAAPLMAPLSTSEKRPFLGIGFLISTLRESGHNVIFFDNFLKRENFLTSDFLLENNIDIVGIYVDTICLEHFLEMASLLSEFKRKGIWKGKVVVGGPHPSIFPESMPEVVDHVVVGEGEKAVLEICNGSPDRIIKMPLIKDLDSLPPPPWDDFVPMPYQWYTRWISTRPIFTMNTSRGCPFDCSFCSTKSIWGKTYRIFSVDWIMDNIGYLVRRHNAKGIYFREDNFTVSRKRVMEFSERLSRQDFDLSWICESRVDTLDREMLEAMHRGGCRAIYFGVESGSQRILDFLNKGVSVKQIEQVFAWCRELGIHTYASIVIGVPAETERDLELTDELISRIKPDFYNKNLYTGLPQSRLYDYVIENELYSHMDQRGVVYLKGHDERVDRYNKKEKRKIPTPGRLAYFQSRRDLETGHRYKAIKNSFRAVLSYPRTPHYWSNILRSILGIKLTGIAARTLQKFGIIPK